MRQLDLFGMPVETTQEDKSLAKDITALQAIKKNEKGIEPVKPEDNPALNNLSLFDLEEITPSSEILTGPEEIPVPETSETETITHQILPADQPVSNVAAEQPLANISGSEIFNDGLISVKIKLKVPKQEIIEPVSPVGLSPVEIEPAPVQIPEPITLPSIEPVEAAAVEANEFSSPAGELADEMTEEPGISEIEVPASISEPSPLVSNEGPQPEILGANEVEEPEKTLETNTDPEPPVSDTFNLAIEEAEKSIKTPRHKKPASQTAPLFSHEKKKERVKKAPQKRGRKSFKEIDAQLDLVNVPDDEILFQKHYYPISEVAGWFGVNASLLRFWENEFDVLKPRKNRKGDRLFRPEDVKNIEVIYQLLRNKKYTIEGAKEYLRSHKKQADTQLQLTQTLKKFKNFLLELKANLQS